LSEVLLITLQSLGYFTSHLVVYMTLQFEWLEIMPYIIAYQTSERIRLKI